MPKVFMHGLCNSEQAAEFAELEGFMNGATKVEHILKTDLYMAHTTKFFAITLKLADSRINNTYCKLHRA